VPSTDSTMALVEVPGVDIAWDSLKTMEEKDGIVLRAVAAKKEVALYDR